MKMHRAWAPDSLRAKGRTEERLPRRQRYGKPANCTQSTPAQGDRLLPLPERTQELGSHRRQGVLPRMPGTTRPRPVRAPERADREEIVRCLRAPGQRLFPDLSPPVNYASGNGPMSRAFARTFGPPLGALCIPPAPPPSSFIRLRLRAYLL